jgi:ubiquinone/menaquinone biosynthesis C-methylase UbiE
MLDLAPITRHLRAKASSNLLIASVHHLKVFEILSAGPLSFSELQQKLNLKERPAMVVFPGLCAMDLLKYTSDGKLTLTETGNFLSSFASPNMIGYTSLEKDDAGVLKLVEHLTYDGPKETVGGISYVKDEDGPSPMDDPDNARFFTMALAGRAKYLSPIVASILPKSNGHMLDVAAGTGYYTYEWLLANPNATATVFDRPEVLKVAKELLNEFCSSGRPNAETVKNRVKFTLGDMLTGELPKTDILLAASLFHDWSTETCEMLAQKFSKVINPSGSLWVHDAFLNDALDGPIAVTDYSSQLFLATKGRAFSKKEYRKWLSNAGLVPTQEYMPTLMDYGLIAAYKK